MFPAKLQLRNCHGQDQCLLGSGPTPEAIFLFHPKHNLLPDVLAILPADNPKWLSIFFVWPFVWQAVPPPTWWPSRYRLRYGPSYIDRSVCFARLAAFLLCAPLLLWIYPGRNSG